MVDRHIVQWLALSLMNQLDNGLIDREKTLKWCLLRQETGFQGRTNKKVDTCYSFWIGAPILILGQVELINSDLNQKYLYGCQGDTGGFGKWPNTFSDIMHSYMGLASLSLMGEPDLLPLNPALNISWRATEHLKSSVFWKK